MESVETLTGRWDDFPGGWREHWRKKRGQPFQHRHVSGNCFGVATDFAAWLGQGAKPVYGIWLGQATHPEWRDKPIIRHGWVACDGRVLDPTRWCFFDRMRPMLFVAQVGSREYDAGANLLKLAVLGPRVCPPHNAERALVCQQPDILRLLDGKVCRGRLMYLANLPPGSEVFGSEAVRVRVFRWLQKHHGAMVPIDNEV